MKNKKQYLSAALAALTVLTAAACGDRNSQGDLPTDTSENAGTPAVTTDAVSETISKSEAIEIASKHWGIRTGDVDPDNGFLYRIYSQGTGPSPRWTGRLQHLPPLAGGAPRRESLFHGREYLGGRCDRGGTRSRNCKVILIYE